MKLKSIIMYAFIATLVFTIGIISGLSLKIPTGFRGLIDQFSEIAKIYKPFTISTFLFIFMKNLLAIIIMWLSGFILAIPTILSLWLNGCLIGMVINISGNPILVAISIIPHGIIELPAVMIAGGCGIKIGIEVLRKITSIITRSKTSVFNTLIETIRPVAFSAILLLIAAFIETYITPLLIIILTRY